MAGEFSFSWSFAFSLVYLGLLIRGVRDDRRHLVWAAVFLALTALCHIITTIVIVAASVPVLFWRGGSRTVLVWLGGFGLAGFWALPLLARFGYSSDMGWTPLTSLSEIFPTEIWLLLPLALVGAVLIARRTPRVMPVVAFTLLPVIYFPLPDLFYSTFPEVFTEQRWKLWNGRLLPYWYFGVAFLAAIAAGFAARWAVRQMPATASAWWSRGLFGVAGAIVVALSVRDTNAPGWLPVAIGTVAVAIVGLSLLYAGQVRVRSLIATAAAGVLALGALAGVSFVDGWARLNYSGYEAQDPWPEYERLMETVAGLPPGRVLWEPDNRDIVGITRYGTSMAHMLVPYWTDWQHPAFMGLFFESSISTPFLFILAGEMAMHPSNAVPGLRYHNADPDDGPQMERGIPHMDLYGLRYYISSTDKAAEKADSMAQLTYLTESDPFRVYELDNVGVVEAATHQPAVYEAPDGGLTDKALSLVGAGSQAPTFNDIALDWFDDLSLIDRWIVADGPQDWPRIDTLDELPDQRLDTTGDEITHVEVDDHRISFTTQAVGVPHLIKVSYFPNWEAQGAEGPYHAAPSLMVVVPQQKDVVLEFRNQWPEHFGTAATAIGVLLLTAVVIKRRQSKRKDRISQQHHPIGDRDHPELG